ncbi:hypothetical protein ACFE04_012772 [Oxalis oulophora]
MAAFHTRSISLQSTPHPAIANVDEQLCRLKASSSVFQQLSGLKELNECVESFLQLQGTRQALSKESVKESVLDGSLRMLDLCGTTRDVFSQTKESLQGLQSSLRRNRGSESSLKNEISQYMESKKKLSKVVNNCLKNLKISQKKNPETTGVIRTIEEIEEISISVFESLLCFISVPKSRLNWSMVSKLMKSKRASITKDDTNEIVKMESKLIELRSNPKGIVNQEVQLQVLKGLKAIHSNIDEISQELECVFRQLVKNRASLLNILNQF